MSWSFSKYFWAILIKKEAINVRNAFTHVFINGYPENFQSDNCKEFMNNLVKSYLKKVKVDNIFEAPYHPQSQGTIESF